MPETKKKEKKRRNIKLTNSWMPLPQGSQPVTGSLLFRGYARIECHCGRSLRRTWTPEWQSICRHTLIVQVVEHEIGCFFRSESVSFAAWSTSNGWSFCVAHFEYKNKLRVSHHTRARVRVYPVIRIRRERYKDFGILQLIV